MTYFDKSGTVKLRAQGCRSVSPMNRVKTVLWWKAS